MLFTCHLAYSGCFLEQHAESVTQISFGTAYCTQFMLPGALARFRPLHFLPTILQFCLPIPKFSLHYPQLLSK